MLPLAVLSGDAIISIPDLNTAIKILAFSVAYMYGNSFYNFDGAMQASTWFCNLPLWAQIVLRKFMDANHHFQYGLVFVIWGWIVPASGYVIWGNPVLQASSSLFLWWFGMGFIASDLKDYNNILVRLGLREPDPDKVIKKPCDTETEQPGV